VSQVVVVGSGMGGLAAAARLSALGHRVVVVEAASTYGGKLARLEKDGFVFDTGPSLLTLPAVYRDLFAKTALRRRGAALEDNVDLVAVDPAFHYRFPDGTELWVPNASRSGTARALDEALGAGAGGQWTALIDHAAAVWQVTRTPFLERPLTGPLDLVRKSIRVRDLRTVAPLTSLRRIGRRYLTDPRLRMMLDRYATYAGSDPRRAPAALVVVPYIEQTFGAWHIGGGLAELARATYERCVERDIEFRFDSKVTQVLVEGSKAAGVVLADGQRLNADVVVANVDATGLYRDLVPPQYSGSAPGRLRSATASSSAFTMMLAVRGRPAGLAHHNVLFPADYDAEFDAMFGPSPSVVTDPAVYVCAPDDPRMRPDDDHQALFVMVNAARHVPATDHDSAAGGPGVDWRAPGLSQAYAESILAVLAARGLDLRERLLWSQVRTPADLEAATGSVGGSIYGTSSNGPRAAFLRPANRSPLAGLFLVGGSAHPGGGLPLVGLSAEIVAALVGPA